jgi:hypothetical protein
MQTKIASINSVSSQTNVTVACKNCTGNDIQGHETTCMLCQTCGARFTYYAYSEECVKCNNTRMNKELVQRIAEELTDQIRAKEFRRAINQRAQILGEKHDLNTCNCETCIRTRMKLTLAMLADTCKNGECD